MRPSTFGSVLGGLTINADTAAADVILGQLHALRNLADYDDVNDFDRQQLERAARLTELIAEEMQGRW
jgi:hypothetical protein